MCLQFHHAERSRGPGAAPAPKRKERDEPDASSATAAAAAAATAAATTGAAAAPAAPPAKKAKKTKKKVTAPKKKKKPKKKKMTTPERRERKRVRDRQRRRLRRQKQRAQANANAPAKVLARPPVRPAPPPAPAATEEAEVSAASQRHRMKSVNATETPEILSMEGNVVPQDATVAAETASFNRSQASSGFDAWLEAEMKHVMSTKVEDHFSLETSARVDQLREDLPRLRRAEEDALLEETNDSRRVCRMGAFCESVRLSKAKGVSPPIRLPFVQKDDFDYGQCIMCARNQATSQLLRLRMDRAGMVRDCCLQSHGNYVNLPGEYRAIDCLPVRHDRWEGIALPIVQHRDSGYKAKARPQQNATGTTTVRYWCQLEGYPPVSTRPDAPTSTTSSNASSNASSTAPPGRPSGSTQRTITSFLLPAPQTGVRT